MHVGYACEIQRYCAPSKKRYPPLKFVDISVSQRVVRFYLIINNSLKIICEAVTDDCTRHSDYKKTHTLAQIVEITVTGLFPAGVFPVGIFPARSFPR